MAQDVTKGAADIALYQTEFAAQSAFINDLATKQFNGIGLLDATDRNVTVDSEGATFTMTGIDGSAYDLSAQDLTTGAAAAQTAVHSIIDIVAGDRATIGASISVLGSYNDQLGVLKDNLSAANSRIKDVDVAEESTNFARSNIRSGRARRCWRRPTQCRNQFSS